MIVITCKKYFITIVIMITKVFIPLWLHVVTLPLYICSNVEQKKEAKTIQNTLDMK